jgi:hypothetical protein
LGTYSYGQVQFAASGAGHAPTTLEGPLSTLLSTAVDSGVAPGRDLTFDKALPGMEDTDIDSDDEEGNGKTDLRRTSRGVVNSETLKHTFPTKPNPNLKSSLKAEQPAPPSSSQEPNSFIPPPLRGGEDYTKRGLTKGKTARFETGAPQSMEGGSVTATDATTPPVSGDKGGEGGRGAGGAAPHDAMAPGMAEVPEGGDELEGMPMPVIGADTAKDLKTLGLGDTLQVIDDGAMTKNDAPPTMEAAHARGVSPRRDPIPTEGQRASGGGAPWVRGGGAPVLESLISTETAGELSQTVTLEAMEPAARVGTLRFKEEPETISVGEIAEPLMVTTRKLAKGGSRRRIESKEEKGGGRGGKG